MDEWRRGENQGIPEGVEAVLYSTVLCCAVLGTREQVGRYKE